MPLPTATLTLSHRTHSPSDSGAIATILSHPALIAAPLPGERRLEPWGFNQDFVNLKRLETILGSVGRSIEGAAYYG